MAAADEGKLRSRLVEVMRAMDARGLNRGTSGNVSARFGDEARDGVGRATGGERNDDRDRTLGIFREGREGGHAKGGGGRECGDETFHGFSLPV